MNKTSSSGALLPVQAPADPRALGRSTNARFSKRRLKPFLLLGVAVPIAVITGIRWEANQLRQAKSEWRAIEKRPFPVLLYETGTVVAKNETHVFSKFTGEVVWKIEEGTFVQPGDVIVRFNATNVLEELDRMKKELFDKEEAVRRAKEDLQAVTRRYELEVARQQAALEKATLDRDLIFARPLPDERKDAELAFATAKLKVDQATREFEAHKELHAEGFVTDAVLKQKALKLAGERAEFAKAQLLKQLILQGATKDTKRLADLGAADGKMVLDTAIFNRDADLTIKKAELELNEIDLEIFKTSLALKNRELEDAEVKAAVQGRVAFVDVRKGSGALSPIQVGESRNRGQDLCKIVNTSLLRVKILANEADVAKLVPGHNVKVRLPAFPGRDFKGIVSEVALVAQDKNVALSSLALRRSGEAFVNVVSVFIDFVDLSVADRAAIRLGYTAETVIDAGSTGEVWVLPWTAIFANQEGQPCVQARKGSSRGERRVVTLGRSDAVYVEVLDGLAGLEEVRD